MCGRYSLDAGLENIDERYKIRKAGHKFSPHYNIPPSTINPVITGEDGQNVMTLMKWGLIPFRSKGERVKFSTINARSETVETSPVYRQPFKTNRALIPFTGFIEWKKHTENGKLEKIPFFIYCKGMTDKIASFAGLFDVWHEGTKEELRSYTIITTTPNRLMEPIHDRMPVILHERDESIWLDSKIENTELLKRVLKPYSGQMEVYPISTSVNSPGNDTPQVLHETLERSY